MSQPLNVRIRGTGSFLPQKVLTNEFFASYLDTSDEWIVSRTGIHERRQISGDETMCSLSVEAARRAVSDAGIAMQDIELILVCTATPETNIPAAACWIQAELGLPGVPAMDLNAACSGFVYGLIAGAQMIESGCYCNVLVIGAEVLTRFTDYQDRSTCVLFGDGAAAVVLSPSEQAEPNILYYEMGADGRRATDIWMPAGGSKLPASHSTVDEGLHFMRMKGRELFKLAVVKLEELIDRALSEAGVKADDLKLVIPHQSNLRIIELTRERLGLPPEKMAVNIDRYGNTSAASIGIALDEARRSGQLQSGDLVLLAAFGAGVTWATLLLRL
ncbi:MAG: ketoacyl-ACP synthase III [Planctomycetes bacterium]|nr:ketoacyl-ACP synthase III [Planctomycetota bacterium]